MRLNALKLCISVLSLIIAPHQLFASDLLSKTDAFTRLQSYFVGKDVDYYFINNGSDSANVWQFYVDAEPQKGWEHDCYIYSFSRTALRAQPTVEHFRLPPVGKKMSPLKMSNNFVSSMKPIVNQTNAATSRKPANHTYALILNGGISPCANYERYWNDCSFIYQTLRKTYKVPKENIVVLMSDGTDPADDMLCIDGNVKSSPLDLDFDGVPDITGDATEASVWWYLADLKKRVGKGDHVLIFVTDHGSTEGTDTNSSILLWDNAVLTDDQLAYNTIGLSQTGAAVSVVLGQCFSGGFTDDLSSHDEPIVVAAASHCYKPSYASSYCPYDEFLYHWTSAINGADPFGNEVNADYNSDGFVSMEEAFNYAQSHDMANETPQYSSVPNNNLGKMLSIDRIPEMGYDLIVRDNFDDMGWEPNTTTDIFWNSPDIWIRNEMDGIEEHENPYYDASSHISANVFIKIRNAGFRPYKAGLYILYYWAQSSTAIPVDTWMGFEKYPDKTGYIGLGAPIPPIAPGDSTTMALAWPLPSWLFVGSDNPENHHFCICARISDKQQDLTFDSSKDELYFDISGDNNFAQKNVSVINLSKGVNSASLFIRNAKPTGEKYSLELKPRTTADRQLFSVANVKLNMSDIIYTAWERGGLKSLHTSYPSSSLRTLKLNSCDAKIIDIDLTAKQLDRVELIVDYLPVLNSTKKTYTFDVIQRDSSGKIVGGETFIVNTPETNPEPIDINTQDLENGNLSLSPSVEGRNTYAWYNEEGEVISDECTLEVTPTVTDREYTIVTLSDNGDISRGTINVKAKAGIESLSPVGAVSDFIEVKLFETHSSECILTITDVSSGMVIEKRQVPAGTNSVKFVTSGLRPGLYAISCTVDGKLINSEKFTKVH